MTPSEILMKHEDANEYHFHEVDRKWIIEAMEEYATISKRETVDKEKSVIPINLYTEEQVRKIFETLSNNTGYDYSMEDYIFHESLLPIELPSDEEIGMVLKGKVTMYELGYADGAKWMRDKILNK